MADSTTFSSRSNAKRAADTAIGKGTAPNVDYNIHSRDDGRFELVWLTRGVMPTTDEVADEIATATAEADQPELKPELEADPFPKGQASLQSARSSFSTLPTARDLIRLMTRPLVTRCNVPFTARPASLRQAGS
jgi:hypothetical protein